MKVTLVADEYFSWGQNGGYGAFTKKLGTELAKRGVEVECLVQHIMLLLKPAGESEIINGVKVITMPRGKLKKFCSYLYKVNTDIIHSECGMLDTYLVFAQNKNTPKICSLQDLRTKQDLLVAYEGEKTNGAKSLWEKYVYRLYGSALRKADVVTPQANLLIPKIEKVFGFNSQKLRRLQLLPNFVDEPKIKIKKDNRPNVLFLGRLDKIKNPELCFDIAKNYRQAEFYVLGRTPDGQRDYNLRWNYRKIANLHFLNFDEGKLKETCLSKAHILINTSFYEALPVSFLEAMSYKCAILSFQNPDSYTEKFGCSAYKLDAQSYVQGLNSLFNNDYWKVQGEKGYQHFMQFHTTAQGVESHIKLYRELLC